MVNYKILPLNINTAYKHKKTPLKFGEKSVKDSWALYESTTEGRKKVNILDSYTIVSIQMLGYCYAIYRFKSVHSQRWVNSIYQKARNG